MTKTEVVQYVQSCGEDDGPDSYAQAAELFAALFGRKPDAEDGDQGELWSHVCAAVADEPRTEEILRIVFADTKDGATYSRGWWTLYRFDERGVSQTEVGTVKDDEVAPLDGRVFARTAATGEQVLRIARSIDPRIVAVHVTSDGDRFDMGWTCLLEPLPATSRTRSDEYWQYSEHVG